MGSDILLLVSDCDQDAIELQTAAGALCGLMLATSAAQCVQLMSQSPALVVVSDRLCGGVSDVVAACTEARKDAIGTYAPVLIMSDGDSLPDADTDGAIKRPVDPAVLAAWLQAAQCMAQMRQELTCSVADKQNCEQLLKSFSKLSHAVNNPLQALFATVDMLLLNHSLSEEAAAMTSEILTHAGRVAKLVAEASGKAKQALRPAMAERPTQVL